MSTENRQHWIARVQDSINGYKEIQTAYFDGTKQRAHAHFTSADCMAIAKFIGRSRYQITMAANPIIIQWPS